MGILYHNPRCSKSRQTLAIIEESSVAFKLVEYLKNPLDEDQILDVLTRLQGGPASLVRTQDAGFSDVGVDVVELSNPLVVASVLANNPRFMQRPLYDDGSVALIARPPELVSSLL